MHRLLLPDRIAQCTVDINQSMSANHPWMMDVISVSTSRLGLGYLRLVPKTLFLAKLVLIKETEYCTDFPEFE